ncbi:type II toxin-antitoxin system HicA family toxin [Candidatus Palauibacter sp.]|uniref:type II toxin-antitoxin system HicA family toxin n=1 Tax=Candidatus Palauibacter sp. TaxID=3101350 RepID=UPI003B0163B4
MRYRELARLLRRQGCHEIPRTSRGSHRKWCNPETGQRAVIPDWGSKDLKKGTVRAILKQLGLPNISGKTRET